MSELKEKIDELLDDMTSSNANKTYLNVLIKKLQMEWLKKLVENQREFFPPATEHHKNYQGFHLALDMLLTVAKQSLKEEKQNG